jgi:membrane protein DedA with SNARE-associated domain
MWSWIDSLAEMVAGNPNQAMLVAFLAAIIEAVAILGTVVPGTAILMAVACAAALTGQSMLPFLGLAIAGAIIGDLVSFWFGARYRNRLRTVWPFSRHPAMMESAVRFFNRYGMASVAMCRFIPVLRSTVPLVAGMADMPPRRFVLANVASAFLWAPAHIYPAQMAGLSLERLRDGDWQDAAFWGVLVLGCIAAAWAVHRLAANRAR